MLASQNWGPCSCKCGKFIEKGSRFTIVDGSMYLEGHQGRATRYMPVLDRSMQPPAEEYVDEE